jgi:hypothetical protein
MAHCHMYDVKGFQFSTDNCRQRGELRMCAVCDSSTHNFWVEGKRIRPFTCEAHGRWMTGEWVLSNYPELDNPNVDRWMSRVWVCETHCDPQTFRRVQEAEERRKRLEEASRQEQERKGGLRAQNRCVICGKPLSRWDLLWNRDQHRKCP